MSLNLESDKKVNLFIWSPPDKKVGRIRSLIETKLASVKGSGLWTWNCGTQYSKGAVQFSSVQSLSRVQLLATPWTAAHQAPPSMGFSRQEYWSGVPLPSPKVYLESINFSPSLLPPLGFRPPLSPAPNYISCLFQFYFTQLILSHSQNNIKLQKWLCLRVPIPLKFKSVLFKWFLRSPVIRPWFTFQPHLFSPSY